MMIERGVDIEQLAGKRSQSVPKATVQISRRRLRWLLLSIGLFLALGLASVALEFGLWQTRQSLHGPFHAVSSGVVSAELKARSGIITWILGPRGDSVPSPLGSDLRLRVNTIQYDRPHTLHSKLGPGQDGAFSHWGKSVYFALPEGVLNDSRAEIILEYSQKPASHLMAPLLLFMAFIFWQVERLQKSGRNAKESFVAFWRIVSTDFSFRNPSRSLRNLLQHFKSSAGCAVSAYPSLRKIAPSLVGIFLAAGVAFTLLECGIWQREEVISGPFAGAKDNRSLISVVGQSHFGSWAFGARGDSARDGEQSDLRLRINNITLLYPHAQHANISRGKTLAFSHWGDSLVFALPEGISNDRTATARIMYSVVPRSALAAPVSFILAALIWLVSAPLVAIRLRFSQMRVLWLYSVFALAVLGLVASVSYWVLAAYAYFSNWALPTASMIRYSPFVRWLAQNELRLVYLIAALAIIGAITSILIQCVRAPIETTNRVESRLLAFLRRWGFVLVATLFVFACSVPWAGLVRPGNNNLALGGLLPYSDAIAYWGDAHDQAKGGTWDAMTSRRPMAGAVRSITMFAGGHSYSNAMLVQTIMLAAAASFAVAAIIRNSGLSAGLAFFAMIYANIRPFTYVTLTEAIGLFWSLISIPYFIQALRQNSFVHGVLAMAYSFIALLSRMGSMFTIPALIIWLASFPFPAVRKRWASIGLALVALASVVAVNLFLQHAYNSDPTAVASNFSQSLCGLTRGGDWTTCNSEFKPEVAKLSSERALTSFMYAQAWKNFSHDPYLGLSTYAETIPKFVAAIPTILLRGYTTEKIPNFLPSLFIGIAAVGLARHLFRDGGRRERFFWLLFWISLLASSGLVFNDDGRRTMSASYPLLALFFAIGFTPWAQKDPDGAALSGGDARFTLRPAKSVAALIGVLIILMAGPGAVHALMLRTASPLPVMYPNNYMHYVAGGRRMTGWLVVADDQPIPLDVPALHLTDFKAIIDASQIEREYQGIITPDVPSLPFGFVAAPRIEPGTRTTHIYIVPGDVLIRKDVDAWKLELTDWPPNPEPGKGVYWYLAKRAEPFPPVESDNGSTSENLQK